MMQQWKLTLSYDGSFFHGWQVQPGLPTVQGTLASVIQHTFGEFVVPQGSGRTDAGVHALAQVASFALESRIPEGNLLRALNRVLPASIRIVAASHTDPDFHARYSARAKTYEYRLFPRRIMSNGSHVLESTCSPFLAPYVWDCRWPLDLARMRKASAFVCGTHDFTSFAASDGERHLAQSGATEPVLPCPVRSISDSQWTQEGELLIYRVRGTGFLHHMVRNLVGTFVDVGRGSLEPEDVLRILAARDRSSAGPTAPAQGLFLRSVEYDERQIQPSGNS